MFSIVGPIIRISRFHGKRKNFSSTSSNADYFQLEIVCRNSASDKYTGGVFLMYQYIHAENICFFTIPYIFLDIYGAAASSNTGAAVLPTRMCRLHENRLFDHSETADLIISVVSLMLRFFIVAQQKSSANSLEVGSIGCFVACNRDRRRLLCVPEVNAAMQ